MNAQELRIKELEAELAKYQESQFHPDWSLLEATRGNLREHQDMIRQLQSELALADKQGQKATTQYRALKAHVEALTEENERLKQDAARLDWCEQHKPDVLTTFSNGKVALVWGEDGEGKSGWHNSFRDAIDAAIIESEVQ